MTDEEEDPRITAFRAMLYAGVAKRVSPYTTVKLSDFTVVPVEGQEGTVDSFDVLWTNEFGTFQQSRVWTEVLNGSNEPHFGVSQVAVYMLRRYAEAKGISERDLIVG